MSEQVPEEEITHSSEDSLEDVESLIGEEVEDPFPETWPEGEKPDGNAGS